MYNHYVSNIIFTISKQFYKLKSNIISNVKYHSYDHPIKPEARVHVGFHRITESPEIYRVVGCQLNIKEIQSIYYTIQYSIHLFKYLISL